MSEEMALEVDVKELLARKPFSPGDFSEIRREIYRAEKIRAQFLEYVNEKYPDGEGGDSGFRRGVGLAALGRPADAEASLKASDEVFATYLLGVAALESDQIEQALEQLTKVGGADQPVEYQLAYAEAMARNHDADGVRKIIERLSKDDPQSADASHLEGRIFEMDGEYDAALAAYERAVAIDPDHRDARFRLAYRLDLMNRDDEAIMHYERLKQVFPVPIGALLNLGVLYEDACNFDKAASCYKLALAHDYNNATARMYITDAESSVDMFYDEEKERKDDKRAQIMKIPVTDFELSVRSRNCLARMNIRTLGDLVRKSEAELLSFKNFGETSLNEIKEILRSKSLRLGMHHDDDHRRGGGARRHRELDRDAVRARPVGDLDLSVRSRKALDGLKIGTVGQLAEISEEQLMGCKNFGQTSLVELKKKLGDLGLTFRS